MSEVDPRFYAVAHVGSVRTGKRVKPAGSFLAVLCGLPAVTGLRNTISVLPSGVLFKSSYVRVA
ncbi:hypothetical protein [Caballeronia mineralivorans]|uniref:hypothetical protein n=1 Tax=Caballeronia mineralivorans TaxID=2010198 RepID=UPI0023F25CB5|nr:hypothetical protein [Caballeronia mineralivorans]